MREPTYRGDDVALFIDWENFKISLAVGHRTPNVSALKEEVANHGRIVIAKAYADWVTKAPELRGASQFINDPPSLYAAGIEPVFVPTRAPSAGAAFNNGVRTTRIKNSVDVKMTADCIEYAHSYPNIGTFVLVSGDSDFIHVVNALRTMGKHVIVVGVSWSTSRRLADQVDTLVLYDVDVDPLQAVEPVAVAAEHTVIQEAAPGRQDLPEIIRAIEDIIQDERKAGGNPLLTSIKQRLMRRYPTFDEKKLGFTGFKKVMARAAQDGNIKLITAGLVDWAIMSDEEIPEGATEESPSGVAARPSRRRGGRYSRSRPQSEPIAESGDDTELAGEASVNGDSSDAEALPRIDAGIEDEFVPPAEALTAAQPSEPPPPFGGNEALVQAMEEALARVDLPGEPSDGHAAERVSDLIVMADTLEHREGVSHVAFNFLVSEIGDALAQGLEADDAEITQRWAQASSKTYVSRMLRSLSDGGFFQKGNHSWREEATGQNKRRRTFNLNRDNPLVQQMLEARWGAPADTSANDDTSTGGDTGGNGFGQPAQEWAEAYPQPMDGIYPEDDDQASVRPTEASFISRLFRPRRG
jgi:uncharacterized LabA/DUF88 family protein